jgi:hypothetical protein
MTGFVSSMSRFLVPARCMREEGLAAWAETHSAARCACAYRRPRERGTPSGDLVSLGLVLTIAEARVTRSVKTGSRIRHLLILLLVALQ